MTSVFDDKLDQLFQVPRTWEAELPWCSGAKPVWVESVPYRGKTTRFFACYGLPEGATPERPAPGVVLVHGGGATAVADWVALWNRRGYAAISMDTCGAAPCWAENPQYAKWPRQPHGGPAGWGRMEEAGLPPQEQWPFHAQRRDPEPLAAAFAARCGLRPDRFDRDFMGRRADLHHGGRG